MKRILKHLPLFRPQSSSPASTVFSLLAVPMLVLGPRLDVRLVKVAFASLIAGVFESAEAEVAPLPFSQRSSTVPSLYFRSFSGTLSPGKRPDPSDDFLVT